MTMRPDPSLLASRVARIRAARAWHLSVTEPAADALPEPAPEAITSTRDVKRGPAWRPRRKGAPVKRAKSDMDPCPAGHWGAGTFVWRTSSRGYRNRRCVVCYPIRKAVGMSGKRAVSS